VSFDPYHRWLGIPAVEQPADHYRLLGIARFESDADVIEQGADRQMTHVRSHQAGRHAEDAAKLLNEISAARVCLLDPDTKRQYDDGLRARLATVPSKASPLKKAEPLGEGPVASAPAPVLPVVSATETSTAARRTPAQRPRPTSRPLVLTVAIGGGALLLLLAVAGLFLLSDNGETESRNEARKTARSSDDRPKSTAPSKKETARDVKTPGIIAEPPADAKRDRVELPSLPELIRKVEPSVVRIEVTGSLRKGIGSGFFVDGQGTLITNYHVVRHASGAEVTFSDQTSAEVRGFLAVAPDKDLAALRLVPLNRPLVPLALAEDLPAKGSSVLSLGAPKGFSFAPSEGIVSAVRSGYEVREIFLDTVGFDEFKSSGLDDDATWIQTTAPISSGNSGGPLMNMQGEVVGVNTWTRTGGQNLNFALSAKDVRLFLDGVQTQSVKPLSDLPRPATELAGTAAGTPLDKGRVTKLPSKLSGRETACFSEHRGTVQALAVSRDGRYVATAGDDRICHVLDASKLTSLHRLGPHGARLTGVAFMRSAGDPNIVVSSERDTEKKASVLFWNFERESVISQLQESHHDAYGLRVSPDRSRLAVALGGSSARLYFISPFGRIGLETGKNDQPCRAVAFSPDSRHVLMGNGPRVIVWIFDETRRGPVGDFAGSSGSTVNCIAFSPDGTQVVTGHDDGVMRSWRFAGGQLVGQYKGHQGAIRAVAVAAEAPMIATAGADGTIRIWDVAKPKTLDVLKGHKGGVTSVAFLPGAKQIVSAGVDGTVRRWDLFGDERPPGKEQPETAEQIVQEGEIPVPSGQRRAEAQALVRDVFKDDYAKAQRSSQKAGLARRLLAQAEETEEENERYALLTEAGRLGLDAGDLEMALQAAYAIAKRYALDGMGLKVRTIEKLAKTVQNTRNWDKLARRSLVIADEAVTRSRYDLAAKAARIAQDAAAKARDIKLRKQTQHRLRRAEQDKLAWDAFREAVKVLESNPDDPAANLAAGKYFCMHAGDWLRGLKHLAKCSNSDLRNIALQDLAEPTTGQAQVKLAQGWHNLAKDAASDERRALLSRAMHWYRQALPNLSSLQRLKVEKMLKEIQASLSAGS